MIAAVGLGLASGSAMPKQPAKAPVTVATPHPAQGWTSAGLDPEMHPIAHLESSWGQNMKHAPHPKGLFHTAYGAVGMKPVTAHEQYLRTPTIQKLYPNLTKPEDFTQHFLEDPQLYNLTASAHWQWLRKRLGTPAKAAFGWRWGQGAAKKADDQVIAEDPYVQKFVEMGAAKLGKASLLDTTPGEAKSRQTWDYSHLLTPENKMAGYQLLVSFHPSEIHPTLGHLRDRYRAEVLHTGKPVGHVAAAVHTDCLGGPCIQPHAHILDEHTKRGLLTAMHEAVFGEAKKGGIHSVHGEHAMHTALAQKHGLGHLPMAKSEQLVKEEPNEQTDLRALLSSDNPDDWSMALKHPGANSEHVDHVLDRISQLAPTGPAGTPEEYTVEGISSGKFLKSLLSSGAWTKEHHARAMTIPAFKSALNTRKFLYHEVADDSVTDRILDDIDVWAPRFDPAEGGQSDRPHLASLKHLTPSQFDRLIHVAHKENLVDHNYAHQFFDHHDAEGTEFPPEFLNRWLDAGIKHLDRSLIMGAATHASKAPGMFEKILRIKEPWQHEHALNAYASGGHMTKAHLKHLMAHPGSWAKASTEEEATSDTTARNAAIRSAIWDGLTNSDDIDAETAKVVLKHPNADFRRQLAGKEGLHPEIYRQMYEIDGQKMGGGLAANFVKDNNCPDDVRLAYTKRALDMGDYQALQPLSSGYTRRPGDFARVWFSKEMVDLISGHPNTTLAFAAFKSPYLTTEHALGLVSKGMGKALVDGIGTSYDDEHPLLNKGAVVSAIAKRLTDPARQALTQRPMWWPHLTKDFYDSVANHEMANIHAGLGNMAQHEMVANVLKAGRNAPQDFLKKALKVPALMPDAMYNTGLSQKDFDEHFQALMDGPTKLDATAGPQADLGRIRRAQQDTAMSNFLYKAKTRQPHLFHIQERHLEHVHSLLKLRKEEQGRSLHPELDDGSFADLYQSSAWTGPTLAKHWRLENLYNFPITKDPAVKTNVLRAVTRNPNVPDSVLRDFMTRPHEPDMGMKPGQLSTDRLNLLSGRLHSKKLLQDVRSAYSATDPIAEYADEGLRAHDPDRIYADRPGDNRTEDNNPYQGSLQVRPGMQKLRKIRDLIMEKAPEAGEIKPKELPPGDWSAGRLPNGNISAKKITEHIDSQEPAQYNFSHQYWNGQQRHSTFGEKKDDESVEHPPQKVFQLNVSNKQLEQMTEAGVDGTFRNMIQGSREAKHPVREHHTLGWVRYDGNAADGYHIDEVQSDFGQSFVKTLASQAKAAGQDDESVADITAKAQVQYPEEHYPIIRNILFKDKHPNEMLLESFHQYLRDSGKHDAKVHILHADTKAPIAGLASGPIHVTGCADKYNTSKGDCKVCGGKSRPLPAHTQLTYDQAPRKMGMEPKKYGMLPVQTNPILKDNPTLGGKVHKFEHQLARWASKNGIEELAKSVESGDFKAMARAIDPAGGATVDHRGHLDAHPSHMSEQVNDYRSNVLDSPTRNRRQSSKGLNGITRKLVYKTKASDGTEQKYMVKPYHEKVIRRVKDWMKHPIQGWAEMANQGLYHAAGIGHLHQKVHVSEHPMGFDKEEPALVVHLEDGFKPVIEHTFTEHDRDLHEDTRKIGLMDFLTNNLDRHNLNMLFNPEKRKVMAIDHSRSFQYKVGSMRRFSFGQQKMVPGDTEEDSLGNYIRGRNAIARVTNPPKSTDWEGHRQALEDWGNTIEEWWPKVSQKVRTELDKHLQHVKDPKIAEHIRHNFHTRANLLDEMANMQVGNYGMDDWHETPVEIHKWKD